MWPVHAPGTLPTPTLVTPSLSPTPEAASPRPSSDFFIKDGRKIRVGECALFRAGNAPPFIGIIRQVPTGKEDHLKLGVNWLYRPADLKLAKGILLEAAPNEVFYSFHKDVIPADSLLHPCKVAFLCKGVDLPSGISSFVCRRVYDIANKCLWWLTDQDYINECQEEVDLLLEKTRVEMHAVVQSEGHSPKPLNSPTSTQQLKSGTDSVQNSGSSSSPSQGKGKKRERSDQGTEPVKRERFTKTDDGDSISFRLDNMIKAEIAKLTERGGLTNVEAVETLVHRMQLDRAERKIDLSTRVLVADVIAATDKVDCLSRFVQLRGLSVLDDWLQEAHKGKTGDGISPKESDKALEELLLALLHALDKLPVNINALQSCHIGKSVNCLRSHKNLEIQRKARSLVDTWKKRVEAEMKKNSDTKSGGSSQTVSWPGKSGIPEVSNIGGRRAGSTDMTMKSPITQPSTCKPLHTKPGETVVKSSTITPISLKLQSIVPLPVAVSSKDALCKTGCITGASELPLTTVKEEKSSSSSQSQNNSLSCSSDHAKTMGSSWKEDARSSTAGSMNASKASSRHHRSSNGILGTSTSGVQKEINLGKSVPHSRSIVLDKVSQSGSCDRPLDIPAVDHGTSPKLIVRLPNPGRSPARSASGGSSEDPPVMGSRASSPGPPDKNDHSGRKLKMRGDTCRAHIATGINTESWQSNDVKDGQIGSDEGERSPMAAVDDERSRSTDEAGKDIDVSRGACSSLGNDKGVLLTESRIRNSFSSMNALIESCAKYSEVACAPLSSGDDMGMNLLASVATGEMSKSDLVSPADSPGCSPTSEDLCAGNSEVKSRVPCNDLVAQDDGEYDEKADMELGKDVKDVSLVLAGSIMQTSTELSGDVRVEILDGESHQHQEERKESVQVVDSSIGSDRQVEGPPADENKSIDCACGKISDADICKSDFTSSTQVEGCGMDYVDSGGKHQKLVVDETLSCSDTNFKKMSPANEGLCENSRKKMVLSVLPYHVDAVEAATSAAVNVLCSENVDESKAQKSDIDGVKSHLEVSDGERNERSSLAPLSIDELAGSEAVSSGTTNIGEKILESEEAIQNHPSGAAEHEVPHAIPAQETEQCVKSSGSGSLVADADGRGDHVSSAEAPSSANMNGSDSTAKLDFDLNEGVLGDDVNEGEPVTSAAPLCPSALHLPGLSSFASFAMSNGSPAPITVASPAKGPFVPPENLLKSKGELGWRGSAATSAFRPAEPRKILEMPVSTSDGFSSDTITVKQARPPLDIDLNVPDERVLEDMASQSSAQTMGSESGIVSNHDMPTQNAGGLDLDLNRADEGTENGQLSTSIGHRLEVPLLPVRSGSGGISNGDANVSRDFDLNNGPSLDEGAEPAARSQHARSNNVPFISPIASLKMNNTVLGNVSSWFPPSNSYSAVAIPSFLPDRGEQPYPIVPATGAQRMLGSVNGGVSFGGDMYRGPVLSSSPAMAFTHATAFPYTSFPFNPSFPIASTPFSGVSTTYVDSTSGGGSCFSIPSQLVGPAGVVSSHYPRPYMISLPEGNTSGGSESSRKWVRQGLDLNAGPGGADLEGKDDRLSSAMRQLPVASSQALLGEQARIYNTAGAGLKRKEPEGGWDAERYTYKHPSWQ